MNKSIREALKDIELMLADYSNLGDLEEILENLYQAGYDDGNREGKNDGYDRGLNDGYTEGYDVGYDDAKCEITSQL